MPKKNIGCARPTGKIVGELPKQAKKENILNKEEDKMSIAKVGFKAPDFEAPAYHKGKFTTIKLADYFGKWVMVCFYPGDFTFV